MAGSAGPTPPLVVWVTGAARGIGRSMAVQAATGGARVFLTDIDERQVNEAAEAITGRGLQAGALPCDVTDERGVGSVVSRIAQQAGRLDVVINNAGLVQVDEILDLAPQTWRRVFDVNVHGTFLTGQTSARQMIRQEPHPATQRRGLILNVGSAAAEAGRPRLAAYGASKAAVRHLTMNLADALRDQLVACALLYPGMVVDGMYHQILAAEAAMDGRGLDELTAERARSAPSGGYQSPDDIGTMVARFIATPGMSISRQVLWTAPHSDLLR